jgi:hypothetical protein
MTAVSGRTKSFVVAGLTLALALAFLVSPYASSAPDGLDVVAIQLGLSAHELPHVAAASPLAGYAVAGVPEAQLATGLSGLIGVAITFGLAWAVFRLRARPAA